MDDGTRCLCDRECLAHVGPRKGEQDGGGPHGCGGGGGGGGGEWPRDPGAGVGDDDDEEVDDDMASLFGSLDGDDNDHRDHDHHDAAAAVSSAPAPPFPLALPPPPPPPPLPLPLPAAPSASRAGACDVSTLLPEQQHGGQTGVCASRGSSSSSGCGEGLPPGGPSGPDGWDAWSGPADYQLERELARALEQELGRETRAADGAAGLQTEEAEAEAGGRGDGGSRGGGGGQGPRPQLQPVDTCFGATGRDWPDGGDDDDDDDDDDDLVLVSERPVPAERRLPPPSLPPAAASIPHYLELRPRCPQGPPPPRIDLMGDNFEELLPYVQLHSKLSIQGLQALLGLDADAGRCVVAECRRHLADPAHTILLSGTCDPAALRVLKVTLILSSLALLTDGEGHGGVGERWFGRNTLVEPKSMHVWPDDSTTLALLFIQLLYRLTRNNSARERHRKLGAASPRRARPSRSSTSTPSTTPQKRKSCMALPALPAPAAKPRLPPSPQRAPRPFAGPPRPLFAYSSPSCLREALMASVPCPSPSPSLSPSLSPSPVPTPGEASSPAAAAGGYHVRAPADAAIRYRVNVVDRGSQRVVPQIVLDHSGGIRAAGHAHLVACCAARGRTVASMAIVTLLGLEKVDSDVAWDRVVCRVHDELLMDGEVRVLVCVD